MSYQDIALAALAVLVGVFGSLWIIICARRVLEEEKQCAT